MVQTNVGRRHLSKNFSLSRTEETLSRNPCDGRRVREKYTQNFLGTIQKETKGQETVFTSLPMVGAVSTYLLCLPLLIGLVNVTGGNVSLWVTAGVLNRTKGVPVS